MNLTKNFSLSELTKSGTAIRKNIDNTPEVNELTNLVLLCETILQPIRSILNRPVIINSGFRSAELNTAGITLK